ncbi:MAG: hypothetical protein IH845_04565 [Nanoarchaeota archaeon]|nr:hypothetical protein [Nanoarchaeota archaeon]
MPSSSKWGGVRIVGPLDQNREKELIGGLKNAIERGSTKEAASQSFLNAGYTPEEIKNSLSKINVQEVQATTPQTPITTTKTQPTTTTKTPKGTETKTNSLPVNSLPAKEEKTSKKLIIIVSIIIVSIMMGAGLLGLYWR